MADVVIPSGPNRPDTLRWALRTIWYHFPVDRVFIVGNVPPWVTNVVSLPVDQSSTRAHNHYQNIKAVLSSDVSDDFYWWDDDHFILSDRPSIPLYNCGTLSHYLSEKACNAIPAGAISEYELAFRACYNTLLDWGYEDGLMPPHVPMPISKVELKDLVSRVERTAVKDKDKLWAVWKAAYLTTATDMDSSPTISDPRHRHLLQEETTMAGFWAANAHTWTGGAGEWGKRIRDLYWRPSPYERVSND